MAIEALIERHWDELLSLRDDCLAQMLSTKPADREKLEQAIADIYELAGMKLPAKVIWFDSQIDARLSYSKLWLGIMDFFEDANKELRHFVCYCFKFLSLPQAFLLRRVLF